MSQDLLLGHGMILVWTTSIALSIAAGLSRWRIHECDDPRHDHSLADMYERSRSMPTERRLFIA
jgi:hypothetical protein